MNSSSDAQGLPLYDAAEDRPYTLDLVAKITGVSSQTILHYQEQGLIRPLENGSGFDDEALRTLRRIEHLRQTCEANLSGLKLILNLMQQVEDLKTALRMRR